MCCEDEADEDIKGGGLLDEAVVIEVFDETGFTKVSPESSTILRQGLQKQMVNF